MNKRLFVEKKEGFRVEAESLRRELNENLQMHIRQMRFLCVYDLFGFSETLLEQSKYSVFGETVTDTVTESLSLEGKQYLAVEYIPGQFDQRASSAIDCVHLIDPNADIDIRSSRLLIFEDEMTAEEMAKIRHYYINAVEAREKDLSVLSRQQTADVKPLASLAGFTAMPKTQYADFCKQWGLAMNADDLACVVDYFSKEHRDPTETELRILDTYWSDHCRHTTFTTILKDIEIEESFIKADIAQTLDSARHIRMALGREEKPLCLMELATIGARYLKHQGLLDDMEVSEENNACSIFIDVDVDGKIERWLLQFKNETHNHPTEIEPFGGASTCLGGAIRDPLSGRAYVYQAMRVTGAGDIYAPVSETLAGKLPQQIISRKAAAGYSSYGNQIGLATTHVREIYHPSYVAKRLEVGAVVGAVKADAVRRESPTPGDVILLLGGRTGRDGIGGATGSSKEHTEASLESCGSEVQKGNAPEERKIQRLFRRHEVTKLIKKSNDFGAGGVSVAIGELADGLDIYLDRVPTKYAGLNPTELAISESQERMAVVVEKRDQAAFEQLCRQDNIEVTHVADVTDTGRMRQFYKGELIADLSRAFIDSAGAKHYAEATILPVEERNPFEQTITGTTLEERMCNMMRSANVTSQKGLIEEFDATIGRSTVLMPFGGVTQLTPEDAMAAKIPLLYGETDDATAMAYGYIPGISRWSPFHGAAYAVVESLSKLLAIGADPMTARLTFQEYFERLHEVPSRWGKPAAALLGALTAQLKLGLPSIGGKDSMSGSFEDLDVPPTLVSFAVAMTKASKTISAEFKKAGSKVIYIPVPEEKSSLMPDWDKLIAMYRAVYALMNEGKVLSAYTVKEGGAAAAVAKMSFGNKIGFTFARELTANELYAPLNGSLILELADGAVLDDAVLYYELGTTTDNGQITVNGVSLSIDSLITAWTGTLEGVFPMKAACPVNQYDIPLYTERSTASPLIKTAKPKVFIPVFPGTNCEVDTARAFEKAGADPQLLIVRNLRPSDIEETIEEMVRLIEQSQMIMLPGGFSGGDEPDGSGKFIATTFRNPRVAEAVNNLLKTRQGLMLGICNGFQALIKLGLVPYGEIVDLKPDDPTLTFNTVGRHISCMAYTRITSVKSPWFSKVQAGDIHAVPISHGEGRFVANDAMLRQLIANGQIATQYVTPDGKVADTITYNPNGSVCAIEGITSPDGHVLGKMGHSERGVGMEPNGSSFDLFKNVGGNPLKNPVETTCQNIFAAGVSYFK